IATENKVSVLLNATDLVAPTTSASVSPGANANGWNNTGVVVSLATTDNPGGSGVKEGHYKVGNNSEVTVPGASGAVNLAAQGMFTVGYHAVDNVGNVEPVHGLTVKIDSAPPTISSSLAPPANAAGWNNSNVTVSFSCADGLSGIATCPSPVAISAD